MTDPRKRVAIKKSLIFVEEPQPDALLYGQQTSNPVGRPRLSSLLEAPVDGTETYAGGLSDKDKVKIANLDDQRIAEEAIASSKFGTFTGVFGRCLLQIWGVLLFLRLGWMVGEAGTIGASTVIVGGSIVTSITATALSALATNGRIGAGGVYYALSRSLGPEFGGAVGTVFFIANAIASALHIVGFAEALVDMSGISLSSDEVMNVKMVAGVLLVILVIMCVFGVGWVIKMDMVLLATLSICIGSVIVGCITVKEGNEHGFQPISSGLLSSNLSGSYSSGVTLLTCFAVFFPALTGINAGINISDSLADPAHSIPRGTMTAILASSFSYLVLIWLMGAVVPRETLKDQMLVMSDLSLWGPLVPIGTMAAGMSSALSCLVAAPRVLSMIARDGIFHSKFVSQLGAITAWNGEPLRALILTAVISGCFLLAGGMDAISMVITIFFLLTYFVINLSCYISEIARAPGWRPSFRFYNKWLSLVGAGLCLGIMLYLAPIITCVALIICAILYAIISKSSEHIDWGSAIQARTFQAALDASRKLYRARGGMHTKTYRPCILCLTGPLRPAGPLARLASALVSNRGLVIYGDVLTEGWEASAKESLRRRIDSRGFIAQRKLGGFYSSVPASDIREGFRSLLSTAGMGALRPNTVLLPYPGELRSLPLGRETFVGALRDACEQGLGVASVRGTQHLHGVQAVRGGRIDIYWLADDGGLTLLLPFLLSSGKDWHGCELRVICSATGEHLKQQQQRMNELLRQLRIRAEVQVIPPELLEEEAEIFGEDMTITVAEAETLESRPLSVFDLFKLQRSGEVAPPDLSASEDTVTTVAAADIHQMSSTFRRLGRLIADLSSDSVMVFVTMPVPKYSISTDTFLTWLETITSPLEGVPIVLIRGAQTVLTFEA
eukprot:gnl/Dysnectes_brevis/3901_a5056_491.p1 GENE.gnl/Dysnectes_brevis/3901_a5056_491~~gnl/Dysnectes_brevis/3901_a5056_491.p1  ORF type:complete len:919 (-),score=233.66 gnl/Dysnectes_brevis/3901_a5056_491:100-2796(-)